MPVKPLYDSTPAHNDRALSDSPATVLGFPRPPATLANLRRNQCRFCLVDATAGRMHQALFCAAPTVNGPYCEPHRRRCLQPEEIDLESLAAEIEAACARP